jgi:predicted RNase H-like nuclease
LTVLPPLNIDKVTTPWRDQVRAGRQRLASEARTWATKASSADVDRSANGPPSSRSGRVVGIDAAGKRGWIGVLADDEGFQGARVGTLAEILEWAEPFDVAGVDIPIGHLPSGVRQADLHARRFVGARRSSVFAAPPAAVLDAASYKEANVRLADMGLPLLSQQAFALIPKILEAAAVSADHRLFEVHPEVSFRAMADHGLAWSKKSWNGLLLRRRLLVEAGIALPDVIPSAGDVVADDVVDAAAAAWSARRIAKGSARTLPSPPEQADGRQIAIWC